MAFPSCPMAALTAGVCPGLGLQFSVVQPLPQVGDCGCSSVSASICWTSTGSCSLPFFLGASGILLAPFKLCSRNTTDGNPFHACMDCKKISVLNQLSLASLCARVNGNEPGDGLSAAHSVQQCVASCHAGRPAC